MPSCVLKGGISWRMLPREFTPWKTVYHYFRLWRLAGLWDRIHDQLRDQERRGLAYRGSYSEPEVRGKTVILIDDGGSFVFGCLFLGVHRPEERHEPRIATGSTVRAAVCALCPTSRAVHRRRADRRRLRYRELRPEVDELVALMRPEPFYGVGASYEDFSQMSDAEVIDLLERARSFLTRRRRRG